MRVACLFLVVVATGCQEPTEIVVTIDTPLGAPCDIDAITIQATSRSSGVASAVRRVELDESTEFPLVLSLVPEGERSEIEVEVLAEHAGVTVASASGSGRFKDKSSQELRFVIDESCFAEGGCSGLFRSNFTEPPKPVGASDCQKRAYAVGPSGAAPLQDACALLPTAEIGARLLAGPDDTLRNTGEESFDLPFEFRFYTRLVERVWVGTNGYVAFSTERPNLTLIGDVDSLDQPTFGAPGVLPFSEDLTTIENKGICLAVTGNAPKRTLWITWKDVCFSGGGVPCSGDLDRGVLTFSVGLDESNEIYVGYPSMFATGGAEPLSKGANAVIGLTTGLPSKGCSADVCNDAGRCIIGGTDRGPCHFTEWKAKGAEIPELGEPNSPRLVFAPED